MKHNLLLTDFLLIKDSLDQELLDKAIESYLNVKRGDKTEDRYFSDRINMSLALHKLVQSLDDPNLHFDSEEQKLNKVYEVVKIMYDVYYSGTGYYIKKIHVPNPSKKSLTTEN